MGSGDSSIHEGIATAANPDFRNRLYELGRRLSRSQSEGIDPAAIVSAYFNMNNESSEGANGPIQQQQEQISSHSSQRIPVPAFSSGGETGETTADTEMSVAAATAVVAGPSVGMSSSSCDDESNKNTPITNNESIRKINQTTVDLEIIAGLKREIEFLRR